MTLNDLLFGRSGDGILEKVFTMYPLQGRNLRRYRTSLQELWISVPVRRTDANQQSWLLVQRKQKEGGTPEEWTVGEARFKPWKETLGQNISYRVGDKDIAVENLTDEEKDSILAAILYEMTYFGFSENECARVRGAADGRERLHA